MVSDGEAERNVRTLQILRMLQISDLEFNTPSALRAGGFDRFAHSAGPGLKVKEMFLDERGEGKKREDRRGKEEEGRGTGKRGGRPLVK